MNTFFLTGLVRSRTAWFANYLTFGDSFCYHDPFVFSSPKDVIERIQNDDRNCGISDASLVCYWEQFRNAFPDAKWVVIERSFDEVVHSASQIVQINVDALLHMRRELDNLISELSPLRVHFSEIDAPMAMSVADYLGVDAGSSERAEMLSLFNVQVHPPLLKRRLANFFLKNETVLA